MKPNYIAGSTNLSRRFSTVGRKRVPTSSTLPLGASTASSTPPAENAGAPEIKAPIPITAKRFEPANSFGMSSRSSLIIDTLEKRQGDRVVHRFDQGPMLDQPAFVPEDSPERQPSSPVSAVGSPPPPPPPPLEDHPAIRKRSSEEQIQAPQMNPVAKREEAGGTADVSESEEEVSESPPLDRWAQIRKNAAERAARQNGGAKAMPAIYVEERSREVGHNGTRTDDDDADGETSGEESRFCGTERWDFIRMLTFFNSNRIESGAHQGSSCRVDRER